ncbi:Sec-independent protein translocase subunit TatA [Streptomyces sp. LHD-70]|uniref:Sec-independent protein translocase subunit TatA n=1 Tax=Streptomyces sp. LHD-70 TaxID=3072140 RepID=UPI00280F3417|nr:Sec-independent protein translocase subunit TatA [Streptomyces sp. LHD-70]MDQ8706200.1 Sec-independent protein translocase subunit TatA [Streptomyces sp. LHD-70]
MFGISEIAILIIVVIFIFGAKKLPELARSAGKSARILKAEAKAMKKENPSSAEEPSSRPDDGREVIEGKVVPHRADQPKTSEQQRHQQ